MQQIPGELQINSTQALQELFAKTNFVNGHMWDRVQYGQYEDGWHILVPECSYLGATAIQMAGVYEGHGEDALLLQELLRLCKEGRLQVL